MDVKAFDDVVADPVKPGNDGSIELPDRPVTASRSIKTRSRNSPTTDPRQTQFRHT